MPALLARLSRSAGVDRCEHRARVGLGGPAARARRHPGGDRSAALESSSCGAPGVMRLIAAALVAVAVAIGPVTTAQANGVTGLSISIQSDSSDVRAGDRVEYT